MASQFQYFKVLEVAATVTVEGFVVFVESVAVLFAESRGLPFTDLFRFRLSLFGGGDRGHNSRILCFLFRGAVC